MAEPRIELGEDVARWKGVVQRALGWRGPAAGVRVIDLPNGAQLFPLMVDMIVEPVMRRRPDAQRLNDLAIVQRAIVAYARDIGDHADVVRQEQVQAVLDLLAERAWRECPPPRVAAATWQRTYEAMRGWCRAIAPLTRRSRRR